VSNPPQVGREPAPRHERPLTNYDNVPVSDTVT